MDLDAIDAERKRVGDSGEWCRLSAEEVDSITRRIREQDAEIERLRALCGDALEWIGNHQPDIAPESLVYLMARLRAAWKGEQ